MFKIKIELFFHSPKWLEIMAVSYQKEVTPKVNSKKIPPTKERNLTANQQKAQMLVSNGVKIFLFLPSAGIKEKP